MAATSFSLKIVTPESEVFSGDVTMVQIPSKDGLTGVLPNHAPLMCTLGLGPVTIREVGGNELVYFVADGFFEIAGNEARLLADVGESVAEIDLSRAQEAEKRARDRMTTRAGSADGLAFDHKRAVLALQRAVWRVKLAGRRVRTSATVEARMRDN